MKSEALSNLAKIFSGGTPKTSESRYWNGAYPWLSSGETGNRFINNTEKTITEEGIKHSSTKLALKNDIVIASAGQGKTRGQTSFCNIDTYINQSVVAIRADKTKIDPKWLFYNLSSRYNEMRGLSDSHSIRGSLTTKLLGLLRVHYPPLPTQKKIAHILSTLDDKIELNRKMNETLEAMAQALFKSWFVDFDPVHAKATCKTEADLEAAAKKLGISKEILELFPSEFEESELGMIPLGWEVTIIGNKLNVLLGGTPSRANDSYWTNGTVAWINSGKANEFRITEASELITEEAVKKSATKLLPAKTTVLAITGATLGQVSLLEIDSCANQSVIGLPETEELNHSFIFPLICNAIKDLISHQTGGAQQHINKSNVENYQVLVPEARVLAKFVSIAKSLMEKITNNSFEIQILQKTRDTLLPKLLSGELDVSNIHIGLDNEE